MRAAGWAPAVWLGPKIVAQPCRMAVPGEAAGVGPVLGLGGGILALVFGVVPLGALSPLVALGGGGAIGLVLGLLPIGGPA